jgi:hypothetical protein
MLASSSLVYVWQEVQIRSDSAVISRDHTIDALKAQVTALTSQQKSDQKTLDAQKAQISAAQSTLNTLQSQLDSKSSDLAAKEAQLAADEAQLKNQQSQLSSTSTELQQLRARPPLFSFKNQSALLDINTKEGAVKQLITDAWPYYTSLYGQPYLLKQVTITFVNSFSISGASAETVVTNGSDGFSIDIHLKDFDITSFNDVNAVLHEVTHAMHGISVLDPSVLEEGITVANTDALMFKMEAEGKIQNFGYGYVTISANQYQSYNQALNVRADSTSFYSDPKIAKIYQMIGYAWYQLYLTDPSFFLKFNEAYYAQFQTGKTVSAADIRAIIAGIIPSVNGQPIAQYLSENKAFNPQ